MPHPSARLLCLVLLLTAAPHAGAAPATLEPKAAGTAVAGDVRLAKGVWRVADPAGTGVLRITEDGTTLDLTGAALLGAKEGTPADAFRGVGIVVVGAKNVTIRGGVVRGFKVAVRALRAPGLVIEGVDASENFRQHLRSTPEREDPADWLWPHENDKDEWASTYGAGFSLTLCDRARVTNCRVHSGQNGLLLTRCQGARAVANEFSFNSGWGIALYRSSRCKILRNHCDWCVRGYSHGVYHRGQDSAGILVFEQSSDNLIAGNSATHSGDGLFLYAGHETTKKTGAGGCNRNLVFDNDFSHAVANAIEATFSLENVFVRNDCSDSDHGIWAGYSARSLFAGNRIHDCTTAGISIEHGHKNRIVHNDIVGARVGVHLWWDDDALAREGPYQAKRATTSSGNLLLGNDIVGSEVAVRLLRDTGTTLRWNQFYGRQTCLHLGPGTRPGPCTKNQFRGTRLESRTPSLAVLDETGTAWTLPLENSRRGRVRGAAPVDPLTLPESLTLVRPPARLPKTPPGPDGRIRAVRLFDAMPQGRKEIRIGPWGPLDPRDAHVVPAHVISGGGETTVHVVGRGPWGIRKIVGRVVASPEQGDKAGPVTLRIAPLPGDAPVSQLVPFTVEFVVEGRRLTVTGQLLEAQWNVRFFPWKVDPRGSVSAWNALIEGEPGLRQKVTNLSYAWRSTGPKGLPADRFATVAETALRLDKGRYRIRTVSDDGIRVYVDGKRVIDNWTHHAPTEDTADLDLGGDHVVRVEHFELDGWAHLEFRIERLKATK